MNKQIIAATVAACLVAAGCLLLTQPAAAAQSANVEVAFSPDGGAERLVLHTVEGAQHSIRVMAYAFTAPAVVRALILAKRRGVDVAVTVDYRSNIEDDRSGRARAALASLVYAGIPVRTVRVYALQHSKFLVADQNIVETGSYNYTQQAARYNSENALVMSGNAAIAAAYLSNWNTVTAQGQSYPAP
ncbi:phospholipase D family protein [Paraburkholderia sp. GAS334]|uniref:phospholipase D family nuclease n=1 Tax=Paraburkholderia sp. GAS334 TaxID=3035131 RepID=UPI003D199425